MVKTTIVLASYLYIWKNALTISEMWLTRGMCEEANLLYNISHVKSSEVEILNASIRPHKEYIHAKEYNPHWPFTQKIMYAYKLLTFKICLLD